MITDKGTKSTYVKYQPTNQLKGLVDALIDRPCQIHVHGLIERFIDWLISDQLIDLLADYICLTH